MEYERIHKAQNGMISPSKLRMKLMGCHHSRKKDGSNSNSARTSPSKLVDHEFAKNSLLASNSGDFGEEAAAFSLEVTSVNVQSEVILEPGKCDHKPCQPTETLPGENSEMSLVKMQFLKGENGNSSAVHPLRLLEDESLDYDSNASSCSFEFHNERTAHSQFARSFSRPVPSKWNDAEKWIMKRQNGQPNYSKKNASYSQPNRMQMLSMVRVAPETSNYDPKSTVNRVAETKLVDTCHGASQMGFDKFSFTAGRNAIGGQPYGGSSLVDHCIQCEDLEEVVQRELSCINSMTEDSAVAPAMRSVCMRDMGTEMTPVTSLEPSRSATPVDATTPLRSPTSSMPSTPRRGVPPTPVEYRAVGDTPQHAVENAKVELTEQELKMKTRREIVALGVQLGKMSIAAWASKDGQEKNVSSAETANVEETERIEFEKRAAAWEEAEKSRHAARYKREEIKIQAWESQQKAKLEAEMRRIESQVEQMRAQAHAKMAKKIVMAQKRSEEKRASAEARRSRDAERTAAQVDYIRQTGRMPSLHHLCCGWFS